MTFNLSKAQRTGLISLNAKLRRKKKGTLKGGIRGASIYTLTNFTATSAAVASAMVTATFGIAEQAYQLKQGNVDEQRFIENSEMLCLDASVSALSSFAG